MENAKVIGNNTFNLQIHQSQALYLKERDKNTLRVL